MEVDQIGHLAEKLTQRLRAGLRKGDGWECN